MYDFAAVGVEIESLLTNRSRGQHEWAKRRVEIVSDSFDAILSFVGLYTLVAKVHGVCNGTRMFRRLFFRKLLRSSTLIDDVPRFIDSTSRLYNSRCDGQSAFTM